MSGAVVSTRFIEGRMNIEKITEIVNEILGKAHLKAYSIQTKVEFKEHILEILIDAESLTYETLEPLHMEILDAINDLLPDEYLLEVSTVGIERPLNNFEEVSAAIGSYIYVETDAYRLEGTLEQIHDKILTFKYFEKGRPKKMDVPYETIKFIRKAVKL